MTDPSPEPVPKPKSSSLLNKLPILLILAAAVVALVYFRHLLSFDNLERQSKVLLALRDAHYALTSLAFIAIYALVVVISVPGAIILTLSGGFLFGFFPGVVYNVVAATIGAIIVFMAARTGFGHDMAARIEARGGSFARLQTALKQNEWSVLLTMRLIPVVPFFIANLVPAFVGIRLSTFAITTFLGIIPADLIYTSLGAGLGEIFARGEVPHLDILFTPKFGLPLIGLGVLAALPLVLKLFNRGKT
ncbi:MAG: VTT domain-containing protein [Paracoccaceae bacterium]